MADISGITPCKESKNFAKHEKQVIKKLKSSLKMYAPDSVSALAIKATIEKTSGYDFSTLPLRTRANSTGRECYGNEINGELHWLYGMKKLGMKDNVKIGELLKRLDK
jgi:hypothetical protein